MKKNHKNVFGTSGMPTGAHQLDFPWLDQISTPPGVKTERRAHHLVAHGKPRPQQEADLTESGMDCLAWYYDQLPPSKQPEFIYWILELCNDLEPEVQLDHWS
jgi:hypothetical protein